MTLQIVSIDLDLARRVLEGAEREAARRSVALAVTVTDPAGAIVAAGRMDGANDVAFQLAHDKAFTAAAFGAPSHAWAEATAPGGADWGMAGSARGRILVLPGGVPLRLGGALIGALGVSGAAPVVDLACAEAGARVLEDN
ncbi:Uncharacterized conserved protein GlcG, DUF336 family [Jiangella alkaliphila]|uniref:Uncharacterized conserved protein GlcG, DUF336 family n=1 Tax=Jiangella alkaliphila TaxID=419479 RepID=A0A1H2LF13_9ACTN|nr:Uncharacterized conserved protein GlcG, DUF336 family [Jiangella alkaliphila]